MTTTNSFSVVFTYYQYNDGSANNGDRRGEKKTRTAAEAIALADEINAAAARHKALMDDKTPDPEVSEEVEWADRDLVNSLIEGCCGGYFHGAEAQAVTVERTKLETLPEVGALPAVAAS